MNRSLVQLSQHMQPLSLALGGGVAGVPRLPPIPHHALPQMSQLSQQEVDYRLREYIKILHQQQLLRNREFPFINLLVFIIIVVVSWQTPTDFHNGRSSADHSERSP